MWEREKKIDSTFSRKTKEAIRSAEEAFHYNLPFLFSHWNWPLCKAFLTPIPYWNNCNIASLRYVWSLECLFVCLCPICLSYKMVCLNVSKQLRKHPEPQTKAKRKAWCFSTSEINSSCYTESQSNDTPLIYHYCNFFYISMVCTNRAIFLSHRHHKNVAILFTFSIHWAKYC